MLNTKGLVALTERQKMGWRLINVENLDNKNYSRHAYSAIWFYSLINLPLLQIILTLSNLWLNP